MDEQSLLDQLKEVVEVAEGDHHEVEGVSHHVVEVDLKEGAVVVLHEVEEDLTEDVVELPEVEVDLVETEVEEDSEVDEVDNNRMDMEAVMDNKVVVVVVMVQVVMVLVLIKIMVTITVMIRVVMHHLVVTSRQLHMTNKAVILTVNKAVMEVVTKNQQHQQPQDRAGVGAARRSYL